MANCNCIDLVNDAMAEHNLELDLGLRVNWKTGKRLYPLPEICTRKIDKKKRGRTHVVLAHFCPFCGQKYDCEELDANVQDDRSETTLGSESGGN